MRQPGSDTAPLAGRAESGDVGPAGCGRGEADRAVKSTYIWMGSVDYGRKSLLIDAVNAWVEMAAGLAVVLAAARWAVPPARG